jgi:endonuclease YncB( thermonuclease family)
MTKAVCIEVVDGDTIKVELEGEVYTLRYIGMDAPETVDEGKPAEWLGPEATDANRQLVKGRPVYLEKDVSETDQYGRLLRYVYLADETFVNAELVRLGYAMSSTYQPDVKHQDLIVAAQEEARQEGRGLWGPTPSPVPPTVPPTDTPTPESGPAQQQQQQQQQPPAGTMPAGTPAIPTDMPIPTGMPELPGELPGELPELPQQPSLP